MKSPNYGDDPEYYKRLIGKINEGADFPMYLHRNGYRLANKSAGSMEFHNEQDRIVLQISRNPITYFNRNDSTDKGLFFKFLLNRNPNFYKAVQLGLEIVDRRFELENMEMKVNKNVTPKNSLEENYRILPLQISNYLTVQRGISQNTLDSFPFRGRIFNAYHFKDDGGRIANIAFPKYDLKGIPKNYILYNKPYRSRTDNKIRKFRLVINQKDHFVFYSRPVKITEKIIFGESAIDLLSYHELHGNLNNFYISFGGNIYQDKLDFFLQLIEPMFSQKNIELVSIMDNDRVGRQFDIKVFSAVVNRINSNIYMEISFQQDKVSMKIHYTEKIRDQIRGHLKVLNGKLNPEPVKEGKVPCSIQCVGFSDKLLVEFSFDNAIGPYQNEKSSNVINVLIQTLNTLYLPFPMTIHKSRNKDWNDDLIASKSMRFLKIDVFDPRLLEVGDKIELNTSYGPEGSSNQGIIKAIGHKNVECDFGLRYTYGIPFSAIKAHYRKITLQEIENVNDTTRRNSKNNNLENHII